MNRRFFKQTQLFLFVLALVLMANLALAGEKVVFSEVLYDSKAPRDTSGEWIELYNPQSSAVDIGGWKIADNTGAYTIPRGTTIYGYSYLVITDNASYFQGQYGCEPDLVEETVKLGNEGDCLKLINRSQDTIDQVSWGKEGCIPSWGSLSANQGKSIRRYNPDVDTDSRSDWISNSTPDPNCGSNSGGGGGGGGGGGSQEKLPFGSFDTPIDGAAVSGSIPVTGWALDDVGVENVKIYRKEGNTSVYIGDALFVEGARPDVQTAYPGYPNNHKAGWGYMLLTHFLPAGGNGSFVLEAKVKDTSGNEVTLGNKTIYCDNANAVKPFGAIDTPVQGGSASGGKYVNWGWVLTPQPNSIPSDGSTINVMVDGVNLGHPVYNIYRSDIAGLFPGYANSNGAIGYFYLDTASYANGVHTIQWTARDGAGNTDGIGSRYFTVQNPGSGYSNQQETCHFQEPETFERCSFEPVQVKQGYNNETGLQWLTHDENGVIPVYLRELEPLEIRLGEPFYGSYGYMKQGNQFKPLPIGSTYDQANAVFYWQPGPGFVGTYKLVFTAKHLEWRMKTNIEITIRPRQY
jgi:hypothetical protein